MTTPAKLAELVEASAVGPLDERQGFLAFDAGFAERSVLAQWYMLMANLPPFVRKVTVTHADSDEPLDPDDPFAPGNRYRVTLNFVIQTGEVRLLFGRSVAAALPFSHEVDVVRIADLVAEETFWTDRARFEIWTLDAAEPYSAAPPAPNPKGLVKDFTDTLIVPSDIRPALLRREPVRRGAAFAAWKQYAARRLVASLVNQVAGSTGNITYYLSGPPSREFGLADTDIDELFDVLTAAAVWVYREARDAETRHLLCSNELARTWRPASVNEFGDGALDSARAAYQAYVRSGSRETLKALSDLRKAVIEEAQRVSQRAQEMAGALWKDIAVAAIPLGIKALPSDAGAGSTLVAWAAVAAAVFVLLSFGIQSYINQRLIERLSESREAWKRSLQVALSDDELDEISERPFVGGIKDYDRVRTIVGFVYVALAAGLSAFALVQFQTN